MTKPTRSDSPSKTCTRDGCDQPLRARGVCVKHYKQVRRELTGRTHHKMYERTCVTCAGSWLTPRPEARFCTAKCKGVHLSSLNLKTCKLPDDHPVMRGIAAAREEARREAQAKRDAAAFAWRTARECPGCACQFTPLYTPNAIACSKRCARRVHRWRRRASETKALGSFTWSEFMQIARRFDYSCAYCGDKDATLEPEHVIPLSRGGNNSTTNLLPSCRPCNGDKSAQLLHEWAASRTRRGLPPRATNWHPDDRRYWHLTDANLAPRADALTTAA